MDDRRQSKTDSNLYFGGVPTEPEVKKLLRSFPSAGLDGPDGPGGQEWPYEAIITYERIEQAISCGRKTNRFRTITHKWRDRLYQLRNYRIEIVRGEGFIRLTESARVVRTNDHLQHTRRKVVRIAREITSIKAELLDERQRAVRLHEAQLADRMVSEMSVGLRDISEALRPPTALPRVTPIH